jgi:ABC-type uncharacterized transport system ATPase component
MRGSTVFMVTHHREQGLATGDRALYLEGGKLHMKPSALREV